MSTSVSWTRKQHQPRLLGIRRVIGAFGLKPGHVGDFVHGQLQSDEAADSTISRGPCGTITPPPKNMCPTCPSPPLFDRKLWEEWTRWLHRASTTRVGSLPEVIDICVHRSVRGPSVSSQLAPTGPAWGMPQPPRGAADGPLASAAIWRVSTHTRIPNSIPSA